MTTNLESEHEMLRAVIRGIVDEVWFCDVQGNARQLNTAAVEGLGFERDAETPLDVLMSELEVLKPDGTPRTLDENPVLQSLKGAVCHGDEIVRHRETGEMRYRRYSTSPVRDDRGEIVGAVAVTRDITELHRAEQELQESEARFRSLYQSLPYMAVVFQHRAGEFVLSGYNQAASDFTRGGLAALAGKTAREIYTARPDLVQKIERAYAEQTYLQLEGAYRLISTGEEKYTYSTFVYVAPDRVLLYVEDMTDRKRAEQALRASEERYRSLFTSMDEGFALHDIVLDDQGRPVDYRFLEINPAFERLTGLKRAEVIGALMSAVLPNEKPDWVTIYGKVALTGEPVHFEMYSDVLEQHYEVYSYSPARGQFAVIFTNVTGRKRAEAERERLRRDLEQRAIDLQATNKELEAFTYAVAHDLRAPLNMIEQFSGLLLDEYATGLPAEGRHVVDLIRQYSQSVNQLAEDLFTLTRMQQQPLERQLVSMCDVARSAAEDLRGAAAERQVELVVGELPPAYADPVLIKQLWGNLVSNAFKFTRLCMVARIEIGSFEEFGQTVYFVRDNGVGFDMSQSDRLFRAFQRLHHPEDFEGSGLGLAIIERIVRRHGGRVWAQGKEHQGASFYFTLS